MLRHSVFSYAARRLTGKAIERGLTKRELCVESHRKRSISSLHVSMSIHVILLFLTANQASPTGIGAEWNATGNPIGGGPGYTYTIDGQDADFYVTTKAELLNALSTASYGDIIYVADWAVIDMSSENTTLVPPGVTLASGRGRILSDTVSWGALIHHDAVGWSFEEMFRTSGDKARITGLRFRGPYSDMEGGRNNDTFPIVTTAAIAIANDSCEVDNCEFWGWSYACIYHKWGALDSYIHHNNIYGQGLFHFSYGIVVAGPDSTSSLIEANLIDFCRHQVAGGGDTTSSYEMRYNILLDHCHGHSIDRHGTQSDYGDCPPDHIHHNTIRSVRKMGMNKPGIHVRGEPVDVYYIHHNWWWTPDSASTYGLLTTSNVSIYSDHYGTTPPTGLSDRIPVAVANANPTSGNAPLTVTFKATGSYDPNGDLKVFYWSFGDDYYARFTDIADSVQHTFNEIGVYRVELMVTDNDGCVGKDWIDVSVVPADGRRWFSAWIRDRYCDYKTGYFTKQIFIDDDIIWQQDIAGDEGWVHVVNDVTDKIGTKDSVTITFRFLCEQDCDANEIERTMVIDDVVLFGCDVVNGNMEADTWESDWLYSSNHNLYYNEWLDGQVRSGNRGNYIGQPWSGTNSAGDWCKIEQRVPVVPLAVDESQEAKVQKKNELHIPSPNPSMNKSAIAYTVAALSKVSLKIYDTSGRLVKTLADGIRDAGYYQLFWDGFDNKGFSTPNGVYFCRLEVTPEAEGDKYKATQKLVVLK